MALTIAKVVMAVVLFILTIVFSFCPYLHFHRGLASNVSEALRTRVISCLNCFAGGVFLGTLLIHILAEGANDFDEYKEKVDLDTDYPIFNLIVAVGFILVAFVEYVAHVFLKHHHDVISRTPERKESVGLVLENMPESVAFGHIVSSEDRTYGATESLLSSHSSGNGCCSSSEMNTISQTSGNGHNKTLEMNTQGKVGAQHSESNRFLSPSEQAIAERHRSNDGEMENSAGVPVSGTRAYLLLIALSFHTVFDGLAVGLQDDTAEVWSVFTAVTIHKSIIAFCLGMEVFQNHLEKPANSFLWLGIFALMSPIGIAIGIGLTSGGVDETAKLLTSAVLQGLAGGTFMYVTFMEILASSLKQTESENGNNHWRLPLVVVGFAVMAVTKISN